MSKLESPVKLWDAWFLKLSTKKPDLNLSNPVFGSFIDKLLVSVSSKFKVVYSSRLFILPSRPPISFMVYLLCGINLTCEFKVAFIVYGDIEINATSNASLFGKGAFGNSDGSPFFNSNTPLFVKYNLSILPR